MKKLPEEFDTKYPLRFRPDGRFRILMMSDAHHAPETGNWTIQAMGQLIDRTKPDFVFLGGDNIERCETEGMCERMIAEVVSPMEQRGIPWAHVFGNHDNTPLLPKAFQQSVYETYPHCLSLSGPKGIPGIGNFFLPVLGQSGEPAFGIWGLDSQQDFASQTTKLDYKGDLSWDLLMPSRIASSSDSDYIRFEQVMWYYETSKKLEAYYGRKIPSLMVFHIPLAEYNAILKNAHRTHMTGEYNERVCASEINSGMFAAALERGDVKAMFSGHDHINTFDGIYCGIHMGYDGSIGSNAYGTRDNDPSGDRERLRGGRIFDVSESDPWDIHTEMVFVSPRQVLPCKASSSVSPLHKESVKFSD
jgi:hypothetical protein